MSSETERALALSGPAHRPEAALAIHAYLPVAAGALLGTFGLLVLRRRNARLS